jgi:hypothetical protein
VDEAEWLICPEPGPMLQHVCYRANDRRLRLFAHACWCRLSHLLGDDRLRQFLQTMERHADGALVADELREACALALKAAVRPPEPTALDQRGYEVALQLAQWGMHEKAQVVAEVASWSAQDAASWIGDWARAAESKAQCDLLREVFGNPFRPVSLDPSWLAWQDGTVRRLARAAYDERRFDDLPVLADALEEAGCAEATLLEHLRGPGPHVRGCWAVDLLLEKA